MAVTVVAASSAVGSDGANATVTKPAGTAQGDYMIAAHTIDQDGALASMTASGWTQLYEAALTSGPFLKIWGKLAGSSEPSTYTFTTHASGQADISVGIVTLRGVDPTTPVTAGPTASTSTTASTSHIAPSVTGVADGLLLTAHAGGAGSETTRSYTPPSGMTERVDANVSITGWVCLGMFTEALTSAAATGDRTATCSASTRYRAVSLVIQPATSGGVGGRAAVDLTRVGAGAWVSGAVNPTPAYPALQAGDVAYLWVENKPSTITPSTPSGWTLVGSYTGGAGTNAADTGLTRVTIFKQVLAAPVTAGTTVGLTLTGNSVAAACIVGYRATGTNLAYEEAAGSWQKTSTTGTTGYGGTTSPAVPVAAKDIVEWVHGSPSDAVTITPSAISASGATFGSIGSNSGIRTATGNDLSADGDYAAVTAGSSSVGPTVTAGSSGSASAIGVLMRVRATADVATDTSRFFLAA